MLTGPVSSDMAGYMRNKTDGKELGYLSQDPSFAQDFAPNGTAVLPDTLPGRADVKPGTVLGVGDMMTRKRYAEYVGRLSRPCRELTWSRP